MMCLRESTNLSFHIFQRGHSADQQINDISWSPGFSGNPATSKSPCRSIRWSPMAWCWKMMLAETHGFLMKHTKQHVMWLQTCMPGVRDSKGTKFSHEFWAMKVEAFPISAVEHPNISGYPKWHLGTVPPRRTACSNISNTAFNVLLHAISWQRWPLNLHLIRRFKSDNRRVRACRFQNKQE